MASIKKPIVLAKPVSNSKPAIISATKPTSAAVRKPLVPKTTLIKPKSTTFVTTKIEKPTDAARLAMPSVPAKPSAAAKPSIRPTMVKRIADSTTKSTVGATVKPPASPIKSVVTVASPGRAVAAKSAPKSPISPSDASKLRVSPAKTAVKPALASKAVDVRAKLASPARAAPPKVGGSAVEAKSSLPAVAKPKSTLAVKSTTVKPNSGITKPIVSPIAVKSTVTSGVVTSTVGKPTITSRPTSAASKALAAKSKTTAKPTGRAVAAVKSIRTRPSNSVSSCVTPMRDEDVVEIRDADSTTVDVSAGELCESSTTPTSLCLCEPVQPQFDEERAYVVAEQILSVITATANGDATVDDCPVAANESCIIDMTFVDETIDDRSNSGGNGDVLEEVSAELAMPEMSGETDEATDRCEVESTGDAEPAGEVAVAETHEAVESVCDDGNDFELVEDDCLAADCRLETAAYEDEAVETTTAAESESVSCDSCELIDFGELSQSSAEESVCSNVVEADEQTDELNEALIDSCEANLDDQTAEDVATYTSVDDPCEENQNDQGTDSANETNTVSADDDNCQTNTSDSVSEGVGELVQLPVDDCEPIPDCQISAAVDESEEMLANDSEANIDDYVFEGIREPTEECDTTTEEGVEPIEDNDSAGEENNLFMDDADLVNIDDQISENNNKSTDMPVDGSDETSANDSAVVVLEDTCETEPSDDVCASNALPDDTNPVEDLVEVSTTAETENEELVMLRGSEVSVEDTDTDLRNDKSEIRNDEVGFDDDTVESGNCQMDANENYFTRSEEISVNIDGFVMVFETDETPDDVMSLVSAESTSYAEATGSSKTSQQSDCCDQECLSENRTTDCAAEYGTPEGECVESHLSEGPSEKHFGDENAEPTDQLDEEALRKIRQRKNRKKNKKSERKVVAKNKEVEWTAANYANEDYFEQQYNTRKNPRKWRKPKTTFNAPHWKYCLEES